MGEEQPSRCSLFVMPALHTSLIRQTKRQVLVEVEKGKEEEEEEHLAGKHGSE